MAKKENIQEIQFVQQEPFPKGMVPFLTLAINDKMQVYARTLQENLFIDDCVPIVEEWVKRVRERMDKEPK